MLPNLLIIGAGKCGTTSLHEYLSIHPETGMSAKKELNFFTRDDWRHSVQWYEQQFPPARIRGESSPVYTLYPFLSSTAERIKAVVPDAQLIYLVRDPIDRAVASYVELVALRREHRTVEQALLDFDEPCNPHLCGSKYASQLERFREFFDADQILVLDHWDLLNEKAATLSATFEFLGIDSALESPAFKQNHNRRQTKVRYGTVGFWLVRNGIFTERNGPFIHGALRRPLRDLLSRPIDATLSPSAHRRLATFLYPEVDRLRAFTGKSFAHWPSFPADHQAPWRDQ